MYVNDALGKQQTEAVNMMTYKDGLDNCAGMMVAQGALIDKCIKELAEAQKSDVKEKPFREWLPQEKVKEAFALSSPLGQQALKGEFKYLDDDPKLCQLVTKGLADGTLLKNVELSMDMSKGNVKITGSPTQKEIKEYAETQKFLKKSDAALKRLEEGKYTSVEAFLKDSAYAIFGQIQKMRGNSSPIDTKTGKKLTMEEYVAKAVKSKQFTEFLRSKKDPNKFMTPQSVAKMAKDQEIMKKTIEEKEKELKQNEPKTQKKVQQEPEALNPRR